MNIHSNDFRVREGDKVDLKKWSTIVDPVYKSKEQYQDMLARHVTQLSQQQLLYASNSHAMLLIFQAMDAAGNSARTGNRKGNCWAEKTRAPKLD